MMTRLTCRIAACALAFALAGCDLFTDSETVLTGTVVNIQTQAPIEGIYVCLCSGGGFGSYNPVELTTTDAQGRFRLSSTIKQPDAWVVFANNLGEHQRAHYNSAYSGYTDTIQIGAKEDRVIQLTPTGQ